MAYLNPSFLQRYQTSLRANQVTILEAKAATTTHNRVFLSHSSADHRHIDSVILFFKAFGVSVYVDDMDRDLPRTPSLETAKVIKKKIQDATRFVVIVSPNTRLSRWIPWELGIGDVTKGVARVALLPITQSGDEESWTKEEYFALYPRVRSDGDVWKVSDPRSGGFWYLQNWLQDEVS